MSSLISYAKAFNLPTTQDMSHIEIATLVAKYEWSLVLIDSHFLSNTIDEAKVIQDFYVKTETVRCIGGVLG